MARNVYQQSMLNKSRSDKFLLVFDIPPILKEFNKKLSQSNTTIISDSVQFSIFGTTVPEITVPAVENRYAGNTLYVSSHGKNPYPPVSVNFNVDNEYKNYWVMYQWLNLLHDQHEGRYNAREINENDPNFNNRIKFTYTKAFPTTVEAITYNYQTPDEISAGFTFVYSQLHTEVINF